MSDKFFLDTNILVYSFDLSAPSKCDKAKELIYSALKDANGIISFQVVQEFLNFSLKKAKTPMTDQQAQQYYSKVLKPLCLIHSSEQLYRKALSLKSPVQCGWYDAVILASAILSDAKKLYSEDFQTGRTIEGVKIVNPFM